MNTISAPSLAYLRRLTNETGIVQHSRFGVPDLRHGYCLDDNGRALAFVSMYARLYPEEIQNLKSLASTYLGYINLAHKDSGLFHNFLSYNHHFLDEEGSEDSFGRGMWGLGECLAAPFDAGFRDLAQELLQSSLPHVSTLESLKARSYALCGLIPFATKHADEKVIEVIKFELQKLQQSFERHASEDWQWYEDHLSYSNGLYPYVMISGGRLLGDDTLIATGLTSLEWLREVCEQKTKNGTVAAPIGSNGWYSKGKERALFDQQPVDVGMMILALSAAYDVTKKDTWKKSVNLWYLWFFGKNMIEMPLADEADGYCYDGLHETGVNQNRGAESVVLFLMVQLHAHVLQSSQ